MEQTAVSASPEGGEAGAVSRIFGVFFSPAKTFESIARRPGWVLAVAILLALNVSAGLVISSKFDVDSFVEKQVQRAEEQGRQLSEQEVEGMRGPMAFFLKISPAIGMVFLVLLLLVVPSLYHGIAVLWGASTRWVTVFSAYAHVQMVQVLKGLLLLLIASPQKSIDPERVGLLVKSNPAAFLDPETTPRALIALLANVDLFELWALVLGVIALTKVTKFKTGAAAIVVVGLWLVYVLASTGLAAAGQAFGG